MEEKEWGEARQMKYEWKYAERELGTRREIVDEKMLGFKGWKRHGVMNNLVQDIDKRR
jgi:hypothetical protein